MMYSTKPTKKASKTTTKKASRKPVAKVTKRPTDNVQRLFGENRFFVCRLGWGEFDIERHEFTTRQEAIEEARRLNAEDADDTATHQSQWVVLEPVVPASQVVYLDATCDALTLNVHFRLAMEGGDV